MDTLPTMTGQWKGEFSYGPEYGESFVDKKVEFKLKLLDINEQFEGECREEEGIGASSLSASIRGFIEGDFISFVKQYPIGQFMDEQGQVHLDYAHPHPEIHYTGYYHPDTASYSGEWEMIVEEPISDGGSQQYLLTGRWKMKRNKKP